jgi:thioredoxin reductase (NADPH)
MSVPDTRDTVAFPVLNASQLAEISADVRHGSMKRVAAAVGEGSSAVRSVHERLATPT